MTDAQVCSSKGSVIRDSTPRNNSKEIYQVPQNSPANFSKLRDKEKYTNTNGEKKNVKSKQVCTHYRNVNNPNLQDQQSKTNIYIQRENLDIFPDLTHNGMHQDEQRSFDKKIQNERENNIPNTNASSKKDVETNTDQQFTFSPMIPVKYTPNSSIINMKTSKPDCEDQFCAAFPKNRLIVQKMPSVNIRPEFTIQPGPKINIAASSRTLFKPMRKNAECFDIVYSSNGLVFNGNSPIRDRAPSGENVCDRHVFPSSKLIPEIDGNATGASHKADEISIHEKKGILMDLIKLVSEKIEKQLKKGSNCYKLEGSLPLLASVLDKVHLDCVKCVEELDRQIDRLIQLMKEELRSLKDLSEDHCGQLNEAVQFQIVELELMQDDSCKEQSEAVKVFRG